VPSDSDQNHQADAPEAGPSTIRRLVGIYDADGSRRGELRYWVDARLGRAHCALCNITHGLFRERSEWRRWRAGFPVPFDTFHRDDQPDAVRRATDGRAPSVVAETPRGVVVLLGPEELEVCARSIERLGDAIDAAVARELLAWP